MPYRLLLHENFIQNIFKYIYYIYNINTSTRLIIENWNLWIETRIIIIFKAILKIIQSIRGIKAWFMQREFADDKCFEANKLACCFTYVNKAVKLDACLRAMISVITLRVTFTSIYVNHVARCHREFSLRNGDVSMLNYGSV